MEGENAGNSPSSIVRILSDYAKARPDEFRPGSNYRHGTWSKHRSARTTSRKHTHVVGQEFGAAIVQRRVSAVLVRGLQVKSVRHHLPVRVAALTLASTVMGTPNIATAQAGPARRENVQLFNIPAQSLKSALEAYGLVTGSQLVYDGRLAEGLRSRPVVGLFSPETALRMLLEGTDLTIRYTGPREVALVSMMRSRGVAGSSDAVPEAGGPTLTLQLDTLHVDVAAGAEDHPDYGVYARTVRSQIKRALARDPATADRIYHIRLEIWLDEQGRVTKSNMIRSSGTHSLDKAIQDVIRDLSLGETPPKGLLLPVYVTIIAI